jgi:hypothetical protein
MHDHSAPGLKATRWYWLGVLGVVLAVMAWRITRDYPLPLFDLYPLYYGGLAWLNTGNAYDLASVVPATHYSFSVFQIGNAYPLPALLLTLPLTLLPPHIAGTLWIGLLTAGLLCGLRVLRAPFWMLLYVPLLEGLRIEQYTIVIVVLQLFALWAFAQRRAWLLAFLCALLLTKPTNGALMALLLGVLSRNWPQQIVALALVWGGSLLLDPNWAFEWLAAARTYNDVAQQPILWAVAALAVVPLLLRDWITAAVVLQLGVVPFPGVYAAASLQLGLLDDRRCRWLSVLSFLWPLVAFSTTKPLATTLTLVLPVVMLVALRWYEQRRAHAKRRPEHQA